MDIRGQAMACVFLRARLQDADELSERLSSIALVEIALARMRRASCTEGSGRGPAGRA